MRERGRERQDAVDEDAMASFRRGLQAVREIVGGDATHRSDDGDAVQVEPLHIERNRAATVGARGDDRPLRASAAKALEKSSGSAMFSNTTSTPRPPVILRAS